MEFPIINNRYQINQKLGPVGNLFFCIADDKLTEQTVLLTLAIFKNLKKEVWDNLLDYYDNLISWTKHNNYEIIEPINDFGEISFNKVPDIFNETFAKYSDYSKEDRNNYGCYFVSKKSNDWKLLKEVNIAKNATKYLVQMLKALSHIHDLGFCCYNLSPFNILVNDQSEELKISIVNLGIIPPGHHYFEQSSYSASEIKNSAIHDTRVDIYSIGVILYECVTGKIPGNSKDKIIKTLETADLSPNIINVIAKCLENSAQKRYPDAKICLNELSDIPNIIHQFKSRRFVLKNGFCNSELLTITKEINNLAAKKPLQQISYFYYAGPGEGKTNFLQEIRQICSNANIKTIFISCLPGTLHPLQPFLKILNDIDIKEKELKPPLLDYMTAQEIFQKIRRQITNKILSFKPLVILIDDIQNATKEFLNILKYLMLNIGNPEKVANNSVLIIGNGINDKKVYSPFLKNITEATWLKNYVTIQTQQVREDQQCIKLINSSLGIEKTPSQFSKFLAKITNNNYLFIHKILNFLLKKKLLYRDYQDWCIATKTLEELKIPSNLEEIIDSYFSILSEEQKLILNLLATANRKLSLNIFANYLKINDQNILLPIWRLFQDNIIELDKELFVSYVSNTVWKSRQTKLSKITDFYQKFCEVIEQYDNTQYKPFLLSKIYDKKSKEIDDCYHDIFRKLASLGLEDALENWIEKYICFNNNNVENLLYIGELAFYLKRHTIANCYFEKVKEKSQLPLAIIRLAQLALSKCDNELAKDYIKLIEYNSNEQNSIDNVHVHILKAETNKNEAIEHFGEALKILQLLYKKNRDKETILLYYSNIIKNPLWRDNASNVTELINFALESAQYLNNEEAQIQMLQSLARYQNYVAEYNHSLINFQKSLELATKFYYEEAKIHALFGISEVYIKIGAFKKASNALQQAAISYKIEGIKKIKSRLFLLNALLYLQREKIDKAGTLLRESIKVSQRYEDKETEALAQIRLSEIVSREDYIESMTYLNQADKIAQELSYKYLTIQIEIVKAAIYTSHKKKTNENIEKLKNLLKQSKAANYKEYIWQIHYYLALNYRLLNKKEKEFDHLKKAFKLIKDISSQFSTEIKESYNNVLLIRKITELLYSREKSAYVSKNEEVEQLLYSYQEEVSKKKLYEQRKEMDNLQRLLEINKQINNELHLPKLLDLIIDTAIEITNAERGFLIFGSSKKQNEFEVARSFEKEDIANPQYEISHSIVEKTMSSGKPILSTDAIQDERFDGYRSVSELKLHSILAVPIRIKNKVLGSFYIDNRFEKGVFSEKEKKMLEAFADQAAIAIHNAKLFEENLAKQKELKEIKKQLEFANANLTTKFETNEKELKNVKNILIHKQSELERKYKYKNLIGKSAEMQEIFKILDKITDKNIPVFIYGESGTGKELVARAIHFSGNRKDKNFLSENCAAISETLLASELFGHAKGAFTGAYTDKEGLFELADGGTLFLDEVGDMSPNMQANLLRVLENNVIRRVGGQKEIPVNVRIVSASNKNLADLVKQNKFREDLLFRLKVVQINIPALRERKDDIPLLIEHFIKEYSLETESEIRQIDKKSMEALIKYNWPGNVRELRNILYTALSLANESVLTSKNFENLLNDKATNISDDLFKQELSIEDYCKQFVLRFQNKYNDSQLAKKLGFSRKTLWEKRKKWDLLKN